jgi:hypothetical protein
MLRPPVGMPLVRTAARQAALGGDDEIIGVGVQRLGDQPLRDLGAVGVRCVDQVDVELDRAPQYPPALVGVAWLTPDSVAGEPHRAEAEAVDGQLAADVEGAGRARRYWCLCVSHGCRGTRSHPPRRKTRNETPPA